MPYMSGALDMLERSDGQKDYHGVSELDEAAYCDKRPYEATIGGSPLLLSWRLGRWKERSFQNDYSQDL